MKLTNILSLTDSYKISHEKFQIKGTEFIYSNLTPRTGKFFPVDKDFFDGNAVFFGLQGFIKDILIDGWNENFFSKPKETVIKSWKRRCDTHLGKNNIDMSRFEQLHDLGYLPIKIKALPEGALVPEKVPFLTIINTHPDFAWLTNYLETIISASIWKPCYIATLIKEYRRLINKFADETVGNRVGTDFSLHNFASRGMNGWYDDAVSGAAFLTSSLGSDSVISIEYLEQFYNADSEREIISLSVPASEHAVSSLGTSVEDEFTFIKRAISEYYPTGIVSIVSDTYDYFKVITEYAAELKDIILNRSVNEFGLAKVVFRPDSGNQIKIICGDENAPKNSPEYKGTIECLWDIFGGTISEKGYKVINERVGCILGDGCNFEIINKILIKLKEKGFASNNMVFGVGSWAQTGSRDSLGIAQKATWAQVNGKGFDLYKDPKTDDGMKKSAKGLLSVNLIDNKYVLKDQCSKDEENQGELREIFRDGKLLINYSLQEIRNRIQNYL